MKIREEATYFETASAESGYETPSARFSVVCLSETSQHISVTEFSDLRPNVIHYGLVIHEQKLLLSSNVLTSEWLFCTTIIGRKLEEFNANLAAKNCRSWHVRNLRNWNAPAKGRHILSRISSLSRHCHVIVSSLCRSRDTCLELLRTFFSTQLFHTCRKTTNCSWWRTN